MRENLGDRVFNAANITFLAVVAIVTLFPIYYVVVVSFSDPTDYLQRKLVLFPTKWSFASYEYLLNNKSFMRSIGNSLFLATVGTACSLMVTASLAYAISRKRLAGRKIILFLILFTILFNPGIIPNYLVVKELGFLNSTWSLIVPSLSAGWFVILMKSFFDNIPDALEEAAKIDGCNDLTVFARIIIPLALPAIAAFGLFYAVMYWNMYFNALLYLNDYQKWPIQLVLQNIISDSAAGALMEDRLTQQPPPSEMLKMAAVVIAVTPILCVYPLLQKHFAKGVMVGSVKG
ncbi:carbohydrate ABC transporter permease [Paenibacillus alkaliterrae]|uniref:carbohydrate ABC transporter permease n=1 Tax=Paenibacillus alkaliterrae TaxID=320909 RepID=UPI001F1BD466|nr:carbohydrate ABC transporter permease [Paenibacillus alkaliterrae]MCF2937757.1 carbohydrate ABC transporter permease [Paenibacillus alkaliterrae]